MPLPFANPPPWTDDEFALLAEHYPASPLDVLRAALPARTLAAIASRAQERGVRRRPGSPPLCVRPVQDPGRSAVCPHCRGAKSKPAALCRECNDLRKVSRGKGGVPISQGSREPRRPTRALPGTPDKVRIMAARYRRGERLYHAWDASADLG